MISSRTPCWRGLRWKVIARCGVVICLLNGPQMAQAVECRETEEPNPLVSLTLAPSVESPSLIFKESTLTAYVPQAALLAYFRDGGWGKFYDELHGAWTLPEDIELEALVERIAPPKPDVPPGTYSPALREYLGRTALATFQLLDAASALLDRAGVVAVRTTTDASLLPIIVRREECFRTIYQTMDGEVLLSIKRRIP